VRARFAISTSAVTGAAIWCVSFAAVHLFWAFGGSFGLASSAGRDLATRRPATFVIFGLFGVAVLLLLGVVVIGVACADRPGRRRTLAVTVMTVVGVLLVLRAVVLELVLVTGVSGVRAQVGALETRWSLLLWNPWFALGGGLFVAAAVQVRQGHDVASSRR
jgi:Protein of unknown function (DUF3995)